MYLPLRFLEMVDNYVRVESAPQMTEKINKLNIDTVRILMDAHRDFLFDTYAPYKDFLDGVRKEIKKKVVDDWKEIAEAYSAKTGLQCNPDVDLLDTILFTHIRNEWRTRKIVYKVSSNLQETLVDMKLDKLVSMECLMNLPTNYFYVDYSDGEGFCGNDKGCILACNTSKDSISVICLLLLDNGKKVEPVITSIGVDLRKSAENTSLLVTAADTADEIILNLENGSVIFYEKKFKTFILNFFIYMYAINKDVEVTERAVKLRDRAKLGVVKEPTNKFKEIEDYNVGFRYVKKPMNKVKYVYGENYQSKYTGHHKCTHYRQAHWHSYWTGIGENKKLVIKWVEGTMINGSEAKNVTIKEI